VSAGAGSAAAREQQCAGEEHDGGNGEQGPHGCDRSAARGWMGRGEVGALGKRRVAVHTGAYSPDQSRVFLEHRESLMPLCFIEPQDAIRVIAESLGREARRQLVGEVVRAWVDDIPDQELSVHYAKAIADLDEQDLHLLAAWHASLEVGQPIPNTEFLVGVFPSLGENRREALKIAAGFRGEEAFEAGVAEDQALDTVLPRLSRERAVELANECIRLYMWDRLGCEN
jgi:hypothetical protein